MRRRLGRWLRADRVFICPECGKLWPRKEMWQVCEGRHNDLHSARFMKRARVARRMAPVERAALALSFNPPKRGCSGL